MPFLTIDSILMVIKECKLKSNSSPSLNNESSCKHASEQELVTKPNNIRHNFLDELESTADFNSKIELINEQLLCNCCYDIIDEPVTLQCGHTHCKLW